MEKELAKAMEDVGILSSELKTSKFRQETLELQEEEVEK
jgi:hypothetical protein